MPGAAGITHYMRGPFMRTLGAGLLFSLLLFLPRPGFAAEGVFQGRVIDPPFDEPVPPGWIFVQGRNHLLRRVEVSHAVIVFGQQVPLNQRRKCGFECLEIGQEIRVTADQDSAGEWRAKRVEILRLTTNRTGKAPLRFFGSTQEFALATRKRILRGGHCLALAVQTPPKQLEVGALCWPHLGGGLRSRAKTST